MDSRKIQKLWLTSDYVDIDTKQELLEVLADEQEIEDRFSSNLRFGTGGLRGKLGAGTNRMNKYTVRRATQALANYILQHGAAAAEKGVAIAYDTRHGSRKLAQETAAVLNGNGIRAFLFDAPRPTPELSYAVRCFGAQAGVVITASHNPPEYNGYKVYWEDGAQIVPTLAECIISEVNAVPDFSGIQYMEAKAASVNGLLQSSGAEMDRLFMEAVKQQMLNPGMVKDCGSSLRIIYSPLHGTGVSILQPLFYEVGFANLRLVDEQCKPDPDFPTVRVPNPEEKAAFELAIKLAEQEGADLIMATDPDADRVGVVVKNLLGEYQVLSGNQTGVLLLNYILKTRQEQKQLPVNGTVVKTVVTSNLGKAIAQHYGVSMVETLTGFKYIGEKIREFETSNQEFLFGYEESFGYLAGTHVRDKDAIVASLLIAEMALYYRLRGQSLYEVLEGLYQSFGYYYEDLFSWNLEGQDGQARAGDIMRRLRVNAPTALGGIGVREIRDYLFRTNTDPDLPEENSLQVQLEDGSWVCVRPSGTEPIMKFYMSAVADNHAEAQRKLAAIRSDVKRMVVDVQPSAVHKRKVLVTGGAGFIGSHVVDKLVKQGYSVVVVDNLSTGTCLNLNPYVKFHLTDIGGTTLAKVFALEQPEFVIHLAAQVSVQCSLKAPIQDARTNVLGTISVLECCREYGVKKVVYASSAAIYGDPDYLGVDEQHSMKAISFYGITKYVPELYLRAYKALYGLNYVVLRYANVYGPRQDAMGEGGVIAMFTRQMSLGQAPSIYGDGEQSRDFIYVDDVAEATVRALDFGNGDIINVSTGSQTTINELFSCLNKLGAFDYEPVYRPERLGDIRHSFLTNDAARRTLHWSPRYSLEQGLRETLRFYRVKLETFQEVAVSKDNT